MIKKFLIQALAAGTVIVSAPLSAAQIDVLLQGIGSGSVDGQAFSDAQFTVTFSGDTTDVSPVTSPADVLKIDNISGSINISGVTSAGVRQ